MRPGEVQLTLAQVRVLALPARLRIVRILSRRRRTTSELARAARLPKGSVHRHLRALASAGLVSRHEEGAQWVYYGLTPVGAALAEQDPLRLVVTGALAVSALAAAAGAAWRWLRPAVVDDPPRQLDPPPLAPVVPIGPGIALAVACLVALAAYVLGRRRARVRSV